MKKSTALLLLSLLTIMEGCSPARSGGSDKSSGPAELGAPSTLLALEPLAPAGCLNLTHYFRGINALPPELNFMEVTTDFKLTSLFAIRANFRELMAYSNFRLGARPRADFHEFQGVNQTDCATITNVGADGGEDIYQVKEFTKDSISAVNEDGRALHYQWLGPQRMRVELLYPIYDLPCTSGNPTFARLTRVVDWSGTPLTEIPLPDSPFAINEEFLEKMAAAVGQTTTDLFAREPSAGRTLLVEKAQAMAALPPREELLACENYIPPPEAPEDPEAP